MSARSPKHIASQLFISSGVFFSRLCVLPANIKPLGSYGFFGNPLLYGLSIVAFDTFIKGLYPGFWWTYLGFAAYPLLGLVARRQKHSSRTALLLIPIASFLFFLLSNFGVWYYWYEHTLQGLLLCYLLAVPFYTRTLIGDLGFGYGYLVFKERRYLKKILQHCWNRNYFNSVLS